MLLYKMTERIPFLGEPTHRGERYPPVAPWHSVRDKGTNVGTPTDRGDDACAVSQTKLPAGLLDVAKELLPELANQHRLPFVFGTAIDFHIRDDSDVAARARGDADYPTSLSRYSR